MNKVSLALLVHAHQPAGNFDHVVEEAYGKSYAPFLNLLLLHPKIRMSLHFSGCLLEWIEKHHPDCFDHLRLLAGRGQIELVGGGYYEPIFPAIPDRDKITQLQKLSQYLRKHFSDVPRGAWVTERVWEPSLARPLSEAGVRYVVLDDTHFLAAGLEPGELHGTYITEEAGHPLLLAPSLKALRYTIPFREPEETLQILRQGLNLPSRLYAVGDDCEKFGVWPGTFDHCYKNGWLERFFQAVEGAGDWLETTTLSEYITSHHPLGRLYLPTASYAEMMEWALPPRASAEFKACLEETEHLPFGERLRRFLRGGLWHNFFSKYAEANSLHKLMLDVSARVHQAAESGLPPAEPCAALARAREHLMAGQCNDAYWHGVFGGLYAPHLRHAVLRHLIQAESALDDAEGEKVGDVPVRRHQKDFDIDGQEEILQEHPRFGMVTHPADGATVSSLRFKPTASELINSLMRRPEAYHDLVRRAAASGQAPPEGPASIHDAVLSKGAHLEALLQYDRYRRHGFRTYLFSESRRWQDFASLSLDENQELARGPWEAVTDESQPDSTEFRSRTALGINGSIIQFKAVKTFLSRAKEDQWQIECRSTLAADIPCPLPMSFGIELVFNLLAPNAPDRYIAAHGIRRPLEFKGEIQPGELEIVDEWQRLRITLAGWPACRWWIVPIETISQSESGFERVYQGSAILAVWRIEPPPWRNFTCGLRVVISRL